MWIAYAWSKVELYNESAYRFMCGCNVPCTITEFSDFSVNQQESQSKCVTMSKSYARHWMEINLTVESGIYSTSFRTICEFSPTCRLIVPIPLAMTDPDL